MSGDFVEVMLQVPEYDLIGKMVPKPKLHITGIFL